MKIVRTLVVLVVLLVSVVSVSAQEATETPIPEPALNVTSFKVENVNCLVSFVSGATPLKAAYLDIDNPLDSKLKLDFNFDSASGSLQELVRVDGSLYVRVYVPISDGKFYDVWFWGDQVHYNSNCENAKETLVTVKVADTYPCLASISEYISPGYEVEPGTRLYTSAKVLITGVGASYKIKIANYGKENGTFTVEPKVYTVPYIAVEPDTTCYEAK